MALTARCWGARGSIPTPGAQTARAGGNTPCISIEDDNGHRVILDAGSGIRLLGQTPGSAMSFRTLLLSHTHWDHIQGLPFFAALHQPGFQLTILGPERTAPTLDEVIDRLLDPAVFPVPRSALAGTIRSEAFGPSPRHVEGLLVEATPLCHPGATLGYSVRANADHRGFAYMTDNELAEARKDGSWARFVRFLHQTHTLVHDAMYFDRQRHSRSGWGHSTAREAVDLAVEAGVDRLILFHHDPNHTDDDLDRLLDEARVRQRELGGRLDIALAIEGVTWDC